MDSDHLNKLVDSEGTSNPPIVSQGQTVVDGINSSTNQLSPSSSKTQKDILAIDTQPPKNYPNSNNPTNINDDIFRRHMGIPLIPFETVQGLQMQQRDSSLSMNQNIPNILPPGITPEAQAQTAQIQNYAEMQLLRANFGGTVPISTAGVSGGHILSPRYQTFFSPHSPRLAIPSTQGIANHAFLLPLTGRDGQSQDAINRGGGVSGGPISGIPSMSALPQIRYTLPSHNPQSHGGPGSAASQGIGLNMPVNTAGMQSALVNLSNYKPAQGQTQVVGGMSIIAGNVSSQPAAARSVPLTSSSAASAGALGGSASAAPQAAGNGKSRPAPVTIPVSGPVSLPSSMSMSMAVGPSSASTVNSGPAPVPAPSMTPNPAPTSSAKEASTVQTQPGASASPSSAVSAPSQPPSSTVLDKKLEIVNAHVVKLYSHPQSQAQADGRASPGAAEFDVVVGPVPPFAEVVRSHPQEMIFFQEGNLADRETCINNLKRAVWAKFKGPGPNAGLPLSLTSASSPSHQHSKQLTVGTDQTEPFTTSADGAGPGEVAPRTSSPSPAIGSAEGVESQDGTNLGAAAASNPLVRPVPSVLLGGQGASSLAPGGGGSGGGTGTSTPRLTQLSSISLGQGVETGLGHMLNIVSSQVGRTSGPLLMSTPSVQAQAQSNAILSSAAAGRYMFPAQGPNPSRGNIPPPLLRGVNPLAAPPRKAPMMGVGQPGIPVMDTQQAQASLVGQLRIGLARPIPIPTSGRTLASDAPVSIGTVLGIGGINPGTGIGPGPVKMKTVPMVAQPIQLPIGQQSSQSSPSQISGATTSQFGSQGSQSATVREKQGMTAMTVGGASQSELGREDKKDTPRGRSSGPKKRQTAMYLEPNDGSSGAVVSNGLDSKPSPVAAAFKRKRDAKVRVPGGGVDLWKRLCLEACSATGKLSGGFALALESEVPTFDEAARILTTGSLSSDFEVTEQMMDLGKLKLKLEQDKLRPQQQQYTDRTYDLSNSLDVIMSGKDKDVLSTVRHGGRSGRRRGNGGSGGRSRSRGRAGNRDGDEEDDEDRPEPEEQEWVQCDSCSKWRKLPLKSSPHHPGVLPDRWVCTMNTWNSNKASCSAPEDAANTSSQEITQRALRIRVWLRRLKSGDRFEAIQMNSSTRDKDMVLRSHGAEDRDFGEVDWMRCDSATCGKWRACLRSMDARAVRVKHPVWYCWMNSWDDARSSCSAPQEGYSVRGLWEGEGLSDDDDEDDEEEEEEPTYHTAGYSQSSRSHAQSHTQATTKGDETVSSRGRVVKPKYAGGAALSTNPTSSQANNSSNSSTSTNKRKKVVEGRP